MVTLIRIINWFGDGVLENQIQALSTTFRHRFKNFQGPCLFSRTFQASKIWKKNSRTIKDPQQPCYWYLGTSLCTRMISSTAKYQNSTAICTLQKILRMWRNSKYPHPLDVDFMCKFRRMRICRAIKITSYYSYCDST